MTGASFVGAEKLPTGGWIEVLDKQDEGDKKEEDEMTVMVTGYVHCEGIVGGGRDLGDNGSCGEEGK